MHVTIGLAGSVPQGVRHRYIATPPQRKLAVLARQIRQDLQECDPPCCSRCPAAATATCFLTAGLQSWFFAVKPVPARRSRAGTTAL